MKAANSWMKRLSQFLARLQWSCMACYRMLPGAIVFRSVVDTLAEHLNLDSMVTNVSPDSPHQAMPLSDVGDNILNYFCVGIGNLAVYPHPVAHDPRSD
ncbi:hypothetical protein DBP26_000750 [Pseudomonas sp. RIT409]|nr:hypothetical protein DBP26_000750 [Pseudomonas sp. RIT 409]